MKNARQISLLITILIWGIIAGSLTYSHIVFLPNYLSHLPESTNLINEKYGFKEDNFWIIIHPLIIFSTAITFLLNWKITERRKYIFTTIAIYILIMVVTAYYFYPEIIEFSQSNLSDMISPEEWQRRGQKWLILSWIRLFFVYCAYISLLIALTKKNKASNLPKY
ncbi:MAG TPA: hypothetical protein VLB74_00835 [Flavobacterium sp.]|uniref:hypothetical protein n=1 Tax=Flavobacterium sp. TaxID=239 RepID=UPI002CBB0CDD|nr:hypothetical protein [Flavobacterium sp.]HSD13170.1 hypothetical protein [Flavobacterium sp.]